MNKQTFLRTICFLSLHISVILGIVWMAAKILDYYNPYMDFSGHAGFAGVGCCVSVGVYLMLKFIWLPNERRRRMKDIDKCN